MTSSLAAGLVRIVILAVAIFLAILYLKLGYFTVVLVPLGAVAAVLLTRKQRSGFSAILSSVVAVVVYCVATTLVWYATIQNRDETRQLTWEVLEQPRESEPEVRLYLGGGDYLFFHSSQLATYLRSRSDERVTVSLPVSRVLGCFQSVGSPTIEGWGVLPLGGYGSGSEAGPWEERWWCP